MEARLKFPPASTPAGLPAVGHEVDRKVGHVGGVRIPSTCITVSIWEPNLPEWDPSCQIGIQATGDYRCHRANGPSSIHILHSTASSIYRASSPPRSAQMEHALHHLHY